MSHEFLCAYEPFASDIGQRKQHHLLTVTETDIRFTGQQNCPELDPEDFTRLLQIARYYHALVTKAVGGQLSEAMNKTWSLPNKGLIFPRKIT